MKKEAISVEGVMPHFGAIPHAVKSGDLIFFSAVRPARADRSVAEDPEEQFRDCFNNLKTLLERTGGTMNDVVSVTVFLRDLKLAQVLGGIWSSHFPESNPVARTVIGAADLVGGDISLITLSVIARTP